MEEQEITRKVKIQEFQVVPRHIINNHLLLQLDLLNYQFQLQPLLQLVEVFQKFNHQWGQIKILEKGLEAM
jgi:hypothetical protein